MTEHFDNCHKNHKSILLTVFAPIFSLIVRSPEGLFGNFFPLLLLDRVTLPAPLPSKRTASLSYGNTQYHILHIYTFKKILCLELLIFTNFHPYIVLYVGDVFLW